MDNYFELSPRQPDFCAELIVATTNKLSPDSANQVSRRNRVGSNKNDFLQFTGSLLLPVDEIVYVVAAEDVAHAHQQERRVADPRESDVLRHAFRSNDAHFLARDGASFV